MHTVKKDWSLKFLLAAVGALLTANLLFLSGAGTPRLARAAGIPDSGAQLQSVIDELKGVNSRLDAMQKLLDSGKMTVKVITEKDSK